jgi:hypothetical protein
MGIEDGPLKHKDRVIDRIKKIFKPSEPGMEDGPLKHKDLVQKESGLTLMDNQAAIKKLKA